LKPRSRWAGQIPPTFAGPWVFHRKATPYAPASGPPDLALTARAGLHLRAGICKFPHATVAHAAVASF
jgi:hypothetical protein